MMSNTLKQIEQRKRQLGDIKGQSEVVSAAESEIPEAGKPALVGPQKPMPKPDDKAATIAALQVSKCSRRNTDNIAY